MSTTNSPFLKKRRSAKSAGAAPPPAPSSATPRRPSRATAAASSPSSTSASSPTPSSAAASSPAPSSVATAPPDEDRLQDDRAIAAALQERPNAAALAQPLTAACSVCGEAVPLALLNGHEAAHADSGPTPRRGPCPKCGLYMPLSDLDSHLAAHQLVDAERQEQEEKEFLQLRQRYGLAEDPKDTPSYGPATSLNDMLATGMYREETECRVRGLMPLLAMCLVNEAQSNVQKGIVTRVMLSGDVDLYFSKQPGSDARSSVTPVDEGWGCGYRNIQMLAAHLLGGPKSRFRDALFHGQGFIPTIPGIQLEIEKSWRAGFDPPGCRQLGGRLVGTRKWIGTTECCALMRSCGVDARIVGFKAKPGPEAHRCVVDWVWRYFADAAVDDTLEYCHSPEEAFYRLTTGRPPLYFQHDGHSRTIVGVLRRYRGRELLETQLLLFDPACQGGPVQRALEQQHDWQRLLKRGLHTLTKPEFEILVIDGKRLHPPGSPEVSPDVTVNSQLFVNGVLQGRP